MEPYRQVVEICRRKNLPLQIGYMYRGNPAIKFAREAVRSGWLGEVSFIEADMNHDYQLEGYPEYISSFKGGILYNLGCHLVDLAFQLMGEPEEIIPLNAASGLEMDGVVDFGLAALKYKHGYSLIKTAANEVSGNARRQLVISGTKATIEVKPLENPTDKISATCPNEIFMNITRVGHSKDFASRAERIDFPPYGRYDEMMIDFARAVRGEKELSFSYDDEIKIHRMLTKACK
jgi:predicted dehydrogenase